MFIRKHLRENSELAGIAEAFDLAEGIIDFEHEPEINDKISELESPE